MTKRLLTPGSSEPAPGVKDEGVDARAQPDRDTEPAPAAPTEAGAMAPLTNDLPVTAQRLLDAAVDTFAERGYAATTTRDIAQRAGLSPAGLYVHYPSKAALLGHLSRVGHEAALRLVRHTLAMPGDSSRRLHALVAAFVTWHAEHHTVARVVQYELRALEPADREIVTGLRRELERLVEAEVRRGVEAGTLSTPHPRQATRAILSLAIDVARWFDPRGVETPRRLGMIYADLAIRMLGGDTQSADLSAVVESEEEPDDGPSGGRPGQIPEHQEDVQ